MLINAKADPDCKTNWDQTPLTYAAAYTRDGRHAQLLLEAGADPDIVDRDGITALGWTAISDNIEVAKVLME
jgi:ankyrin repeat protein